MLKKAITFNDLDGKPLTEDFYFNLNKAEIAEMEIGTPGGYAEYLTEIVKAENAAAIIATFKKLITASVGRRSEDGRKFIKNQEITDDFLQTEAYSALFMELMSDAQSAVEFFKGIMPADLQGSFDEAQVKEGVQNVQLPADDQPAWIKENREPSQAELRTMSPDQIQAAYARKLGAGTQ